MCLIAKTRLLATCWRDVDGQCLGQAAHASAADARVTTGVADARRAKYRCGAIGRHEFSGAALSAQCLVARPRSWKTWARCRATSGTCRRNRRPTDFVGPDLREPRRFVGACCRSCPRHGYADHRGADPRVDRSETINQPLATPAARNRVPSASGDQFWGVCRGGGGSSSAPGPRYVGAFAASVRLQPYRGVDGRADGDPPR